MLSYFQIETSKLGSSQKQCTLVNDKWKTRLFVQQQPVIYHGETYVKCCIGNQMWQAFKQ